MLEVEKQYLELENQYYSKQNDLSLQHHTVEASNKLFDITKAYRYIGVMHKLQYSYVNAWSSTSTQNTIESIQKEWNLAKGTYAKATKPNKEAMKTITSNYKKRSKIKKEDNIIESFSSFFDPLFYKTHHEFIKQYVVYKIAWAKYLNFILNTQHDDSDQFCNKVLEHYTTLNALGMSYINPYVGTNVATGFMIDIDDHSSLASDEEAIIIENLIKNLFDYNVFEKSLGNKGMHFYIKTKDNITTKYLKQLEVYLKSQLVKLNVTGIDIEIKYKLVRSPNSLKYNLEEINDVYEDMIYIKQLIENIVVKEKTVAVIRNKKVLPNNNLVMGRTYDNYITDNKSTHILGSKESVTNIVKNTKFNLGSRNDVLPNFVNACILYGMSLQETISQTYTNGGSSKDFTTDAGRKAHEASIATLYSGSTMKFNQYNGEGNSFNSNGNTTKFYSNKKYIPDHFKEELKKIEVELEKAVNYTFRKRKSLIPTYIALVKEVIEETVGKFFYNQQHQRIIKSPLAQVIKDFNTGVNIDKLSIQMIIQNFFFNNKEYTLPYNKSANFLKIIEILKNLNIFKLHIHEKDKSHSTEITRETLISPLEINTIEDYREFNYVFDVHSRQIVPIVDSDDMESSLLESISKCKFKVNDNFSNNYEESKNVIKRKNAEKVNNQLLKVKFYVNKKRRFRIEFKKLKNSDKDLLSLLNTVSNSNLYLLESNVISSIILIFTTINNKISYRLINNKIVSKIINNKKNNIVIYLTQFVLRLDIKRTYFMEFQPL